jgi:hypothetical protein
MELIFWLLVIVGLILVFALGPLLAFLDILSRELMSERGLSGSRLAKGFLVLLIPFAWIVYFAVFRRQRPFT